MALNRWECTSKPFSGPLCKAYKWTQYFWGRMSLLLYCRNCDW